MIMVKDYQKVKSLALAAAANSTAAKRKVGCVVVMEDAQGVQRYAVGYNLLRVYKDGEWVATDKPCEDEAGETISTPTERVFHAEENAILAAKQMKQTYPDLNYVGVFVTHPPCDNCMKVIHRASHPLLDVRVVTDFIKFDTDKLRYDLLPPLAIEEVVLNLTRGAKKYKPNNWREVDDINRYLAAAMRHIEAHRKGELIDEDQGCMHVAMAATNLLFVTELLKGEQR